MDGIIVEENDQSREESLKSDEFLNLDNSFADLE
jgi:hypothetical protein